MNLATAEHLAFALILVRAFLCLRTPPRDTYTTERSKYDNLPNKA
jgi:hypothetical protein